MYQFQDPMYHWVVYVPVLVHYASSSLAFTLAIYMCLSFGFLFSACLPSFYGYRLINSLNAKLEWATSLSAADPPHSAWIRSTERPSNKRSIAKWMLKYLWMHICMCMYAYMCMYVFTNLRLDGFTLSRSSTWVIYMWKCSADSVIHTTTWQI